MNSRGIKIKEALIADKILSVRGENVLLNCMK